MKARSALEAGGGASADCGADEVGAPVVVLPRPLFEWLGRNFIGLGGGGGSPVVDDCAFASSLNDIVRVLRLFRAVLTSFGRLALAASVRASRTLYRQYL